ncbi:MAG: hypothetical protein IKT40_13595 [Bacilli bacterium]|nr:hypothetical protein [Bacilli bacterium]
MTKQEFLNTLEQLILQTDDLLILFIKAFFSKEEIDQYGYTEQVKKYKKRHFYDEYQIWYSESLKIIKIFMPERYDEFIEQYQPEKKRKELNILNYTIYDALCIVGNKRISPAHAVSKLQIQFNILKSIKQIINDKLNELNSLLELDVFEKELDAARSLHKNKYYRSAGAICGVLIEKHLSSILDSNKIKITKKDPTINDLNQLLYANNLIDLTQNKFLVYMGDIRNKCDHNKSVEPTANEVLELINGTDKIIKTYN